MCVVLVVCVTVLSLNVSVTASECMMRNEIVGKVRGLGDPSMTRKGYFTFYELFLGFHFFVKL